jgi:ribosome-binding protein aMBF1 (putative translation factor)
MTTLNIMENFVEAIEEGKIVKVSESYARLEGLPIIRKPSISKIKEKLDSPELPLPQKHKDPKSPQIPDLFERKLNWRDDQVINELIQNFHWHISKERKRKNLSRKQLGQLVNEPEENIKMIENGILPNKDFIIVNKIQKALDLNLRKDRKDIDITMHAMLKEQKPSLTEYKAPPKKKESNNSLYGDEIEIIED